MAKETERKFLVNDRSYRTLGEKKYYKQGYLSTEKGRTVRVRVIDNQGYITIKGPAHSLSRDEYEYPVPAGDANEMLEKLCLKPLIEKYRYKVPCGKHTWEIDEFLGVNEGLTVAEIELTDENEAFEKPGWIGREVTDERRYFNSCLVQYPYSSWSPDEK